ncbi:putative RNA-directed DNA polymerase from transposon BS [Stylophora pistillata]|uniref:Putative RNA-directed DNA polymerase from transposon BS n=1 Tax=Stylophora pistillata TaxID=50429 RepID=A0A2B4S6Q9_STYPI|nr:putative RNA-directed DNA polymerase from transposon BS [Stylophora pistillata]
MNDLNDELEGHFGVNCEYSWVFPTIHGTHTDENQDVNIDEEIDENLPLASVLLPPKSPINENCTQNPPPSTDENCTQNPSPSADICTQDPPSPPPPDDFNETQPPSQPEQSEQHSQPEQPLQHFQPEQQHSQPELPSHNLSEQSSQASSISSDSPILDPHGFIAPKPIKPSFRRTRARLRDLSLACTRKPTTPTLTTGKPRFSIPVPTTASSHPLYTSETENDMETTHDLKRKSSDVSPSRKETTPTEKKKGKNKHSKKSKRNRVKLGPVTSQWKDTIRGCPQGSSFGPLLWNSFQNDLTYITEEGISMYADDHQIFASGSSASIVQEKLLSEGSKITKWYKENLLQVSVQKYQSMLMGSGTEAKNSISLHIDGTDIEQSKSIKLLGVLLDSELNLSEHITLVCKKASQQKGVLSRLSKLIPTYAKLKLYKAAISPHLTYCSIIWHFCRASDKRKAERLQERAWRAVLNNKSLSYDGLLRLAEILSLVNTRLQDIAILMFKISPILVAKDLGVFLDQFLSYDEHAVLLLLSVEQYFGD